MKLSEIIIKMKILRALKNIRINNLKNIKNDLLLGDEKLGKNLNDNFKIILNNNLN